MQGSYKHSSTRTPTARRALIGILFSLLAATSACKSDYPAGAQQKGPGGGGNREAREVRTARVEEMPVGQTVTVNGTLAAFDQTTVGVKVPGRLQGVAVDLGSVVRRGQLVARVEPRDYELRVQQADAALQQARARLSLSLNGSDDLVDPEKTGTVRQARALMDEARNNRDRAATLVQSGVIARAEYDAASAALKVAESRYQDAVEEIRNRQALLSQRRTELALARQQLQDTAVHAPFDGVVEEKSASVGEYLAAGAPVVRIVKMNPLRFQAEVPEREAATIRSGQMLRVTVEGSQRAYAGRIVRLSPVIKEQSRVLVVEADISNDGLLRPGSFARAEIVVNDAQMAVTVPSNAIVTFAGIEKVIIVDNGRAQEKPITTGRRAAEWTEIISGVNVGDAVVIEPGNLQSGQPVNVVE
ncbi:MAG TPA: efflux RND transporter periplasmic adaptor subunit [Pyrinomonadaceae bacterium]|nr:efflux RND transporter periplasmic adaptor subunit [Pyrinomonadaceae bacterium]